MMKLSHALLGTLAAACVSAPGRSRELCLWRGRRRCGRAVRLAPGSREIACSLIVQSARIRRPEAER